MFVGRQNQLARLAGLLHPVLTENDQKPGKAPLNRGRWRVDESPSTRQVIAAYEPTD